MLSKTRSMPTYSFQKNPMKLLNMVTCNWLAT
jgi:hypothetical protein